MYVLCVYVLSLFAYVIYIRNMYVENTLNSVRRIKKECTWYIDRVLNSELPRTKIMIALIRRINRSTYWLLCSVRAVQALSPIKNSRVRLEKFSCSSTRSVVYNGTQSGTVICTVFYLSNHIVIVNNIVKRISVTGTLSWSDVSRTQQRVPALYLRRLSCCAHIVPMLKLLRTGTV